MIQVIRPEVVDLMGRAAECMTTERSISPKVPIKVGIDLGTAFTVIMVTDADDQPLAGASVFADIVRDGIVWDFAGAIQIVRDLKEELEQRTGRQITQGTVTIPPAVTEADARAHRYVLEGAGIECTDVIDEVTAANAVLGIVDGAVVDIGGGTTGIAVLRDGKTAKLADEPSGGTHMSLVLSGALKIPFDEAELLKRDPANHIRLAPVVGPVLEKMSTIVSDTIAGEQVECIFLVGGTSAFAGVDRVMTRVTGVPAVVAPEPMLVTPLGVARWATPYTEEGSL